MDDVNVLPAGGDGHGLQHCVYAAVFHPAGFPLFRFRPPGLISCNKANRSSPYYVSTAIASLCRHDDGGGVDGDSLGRQYIPITACKARELTATRWVFSFLTSPVKSVRRNGHAVSADDVSVFF